MKAYSGLHGYAFMSYSHKDEERIKPLVERLQGVGCKIWYDEGIMPADEWAETVAKKLAGASLFFLVLSKNSAASQNVKREIYYAVSNDLPILTYYLEDVELSQGLAMQLGISQSVKSDNNSESDYKTLCKLFPNEVKGGVEPEIIYTSKNYIYAFLQAQFCNEYTIISINRETHEQKPLFKHKDSGAFAAWYTCDSIHFSPSDEFNPNREGTLYFSVLSDLDHDLGVPAFDRYAEIAFAITGLDSPEAKLTVLGGRTKRKCDPFEKTETFSGSEPRSWMRNALDDE